MKSSAVRITTMSLGAWDDSPALKAAWQDLLSRSPDCSVFQSYQWHVCWWRAFGAPHKLMLILGYADSRLVGIAPLMIRRAKTTIGWVRRSACFIGSTNNASDYCDFIIDPNVPGVLNALLDKVLGASTHYHRLELSHFPSHSPNLARVIEYLRARGFWTSMQEDAEAPVRVLGDKESDLRALNKSSLRRHTNYFRKAGDLRFHQCKSEAEILAYLDEFFYQHKTRRERTDSPSQFLDPAQREFFRELVHEFVPSGWLRFDAVLFNGVPIAFHFGFEYCGCFIWYKPTFDTRMASRSPGEVLIRFLLEDAINRGLKEFDFTVGNESFKHRFANRVRFNNRLSAFFSRADYCVFRARFIVKKLLGRESLPGRVSAPMAGQTLVD